MAGLKNPIGDPQSIGCPEARMNYIIIPRSISARVGRNLKPLQPLRGRVKGVGEWKRMVSFIDWVNKANWPLYLYSQVTRFPIFGTFLNPAGDNETFLSRRNVIKNEQKQCIQINWRSLEKDFPHLCFSKILVLKYNRILHSSWSFLDSNACQNLQKQRDKELLALTDSVEKLLKNNMGNTLLAPQIATAIRGGARRT